MSDSSNSDRLHALDATRAFALLLGVVFLGARSLVPAPMGGPVLDASASRLFDWFFFSSHTFRMELFFLVAGFFAHLVFHRRGFTTVARQPAHAHRRGARCQWTGSEKSPSLETRLRALTRYSPSMPGDVTRLLSAIDSGDAKAADELMPLVYEELRRLAAARMANEKPGQTLQATALVHEAWLRLGGDDQQTWQNREHFFGAAAEAMRRILVDRARRRAASRHGGGHERVDLQEADIAAPIGRDEELLAIHDVLDRFTLLDPLKARLVKLRYFTGLTIDETAAALGISSPTAKRWWSYARAWLKVEIAKGK